MKKYLSILLIFTAISCEKYLEPKSQTEYMPRDANSLNEMLIGNAYLDPTNMITPIFAYNEIFSDDWGCTVENCVNTSNETRYSEFKPIFSWHPEAFQKLNESSQYQKVWKSTYEKILGCNAVLDYIDDVSGKDDMKKYVKGQALALRAFYYFNIVNLYGEPYNYNKSALGVPLKLNSNTELDNLPRNTVDQVYQQILTDLKNAEDYFASLPLSMKNTKDGRVNLPMIQLLRARVALFMEDWDNVIKYSENVIEDWGLSLFNLNSFTPTTAAPYYSFTSYDNPEAIWAFGSIDDMSKFSAITLYRLPTSTSQTRRMFNASQSLLSSYGVSDLRKDRYIIKESNTISNYTTRAKMPVNATYGNLSTMFARALRLSEAYLMLAEASFMKNDPSTSVRLLEELRHNRFVANSGDVYKIPADSTSGPALLKFIKNERRREMCFEGMRWFDLRRWGMESFSREWKEEGVVVATFTIEKNDPAFTLPVPFDAIEKNSKLEQNKLATPKY
ncbi:MAG: RagB/SusD family nutrient uptake outer membrane protein [Rikenellaceae bacterium]|nr:RagB/SusD family nutrient uptake outer membrane protein [Rikenellaceae bacterium]